MHRWKLFNFIPAAILLIILLLSIFRLSGKHTEVRAQSGSITFGMAGDYATGGEFHNTITSMKNSGLNFAVVTGDFSYSPGSAATTWDNYVLTTLGSNFPFELIAGNHDAGYLSDFTTLLPNRISSMVTYNATSYGGLYYFDYPVTSPLIRVIMMGPNESPLNYTYAANSTYYNWVQNAIVDAHNKNIPWVAVAMHKNCITSGTKSCEIGTAVFNLFINQHVDLILQGHDHTYQRSFPLHTAASDPVKGAGCASVSTTFSSACVSSTLGNNYPSTSGTTLVIDGTGGQSLYSNDQTGQNPFFAAKNFSSFGFTKFTVTASQITASFINNSSGGFTDSFTITKSSTGGTPSPTVVRPSPTGTPLQGDANGDGHVNITDLQIWLSHYGQQTFGTTVGDFTGDGKVNTLDFGWIALNYGR